MPSLVDDEGECISEDELLSFSSNLQRVGCMLVFKTILDIGSFRTSQRAESMKVITSIQNIENVTGMKHIERVESIGSVVRREKIKDIERITGVRSI